MENPSPPNPPADVRPFDTFTALVSKVVRVPKAKVDAMEAAYQREQAKKPKRGPKSK